MKEVLHLSFVLCLLAAIFVISQFTCNNPHYMIRKNRYSNRNSILWQFDHKVTKTWTTELFHQKCLSSGSMPGIINMEARPKFRIRLQMTYPGILVACEDYDWKAYKLSVEYLVQLRLHLNVKENVCRIILLTQKAVEACCC